MLYICSSTRCDPSCWGAQAADGLCSMRHADCRSARAAHVVGGCSCCCCRGFHTTTWVSVEGRFYPGFLLHLRIRPSTIDITYDQVVSQRPYGRWIDCLPNRTWRPRQPPAHNCFTQDFPPNRPHLARTYHPPKPQPAVRPRSTVSQSRYGRPLPALALRGAMLAVPPGAARALGGSPGGGRGRVRPRCALEGVPAGRARNKGWMLSIALKKPALAHGRR